MAKKSSSKEHGFSHAIYDTFKVNLSPVSSGKELVGTCPFPECSKENHFYVNAKSGVYNCKRCGASGNQITFLQRMHSAAFANTKTADWKRLSELRGNLPWKAFANRGLAFDKNINKWLIPIRSTQGSIISIRTWIEPQDGKKYPLINLTEAHLWGLDSVENQGPIFICEGEWDGIALSYVCETLNLPTPIIAVPGCEVFKDIWLDLFKQRDVILLYDNDGPGGNGMARTANLLKNKARSVRKVEWPSTVPEGYDIRDLVCDNLDSPERAWKTINKMVQGSVIARKTNHTTFASVVSNFKKYIHFDKAYENALAVMFAVSFSTRVPGDPLWLFLVGPPGSGKSLLLKAFGADEDHCVEVSKLSSQAFISGYKMDDGSDPSLLSRAQNKTVVIKDYTAVRSLPIPVQEELYGILRDAYDGSVTVSYGNGIVRQYRDLWFTLIAGVTDVIHGDNRAALGERFLKIELLDDTTHNSEIHIRSALSASIAENIDGENSLKESVASFLAKECNEKVLPDVPANMIDRYVALSQVISVLRAVVPRDKHGELLYRPIPEIGTRLASQFRRLSRFLAFVFGTRVDNRIYELIRRVALDTATGWNLETLAALMEHGEGMATVDVAEALQLSVNHVRQRLNDLLELDVISRELTDDDDIRDRRYLWTVRSDFLSLWKRAKLDEVDHLLSVRARSGHCKQRGKYNVSKSAKKLAQKSRSKNGRTKKTTAGAKANRTRTG